MHLGRLEDGDLEQAQYVTHGRCDQIDEEIGQAIDHPEEKIVDPVGYAVEGADEAHMLRILDVDEKLRALHVRVPGDSDVASYGSADRDAGKL